MAAPVIASRATTSIGSNTTSHSVNLPTGIQAGDFILILGSFDGSSNSIISAYPDSSYHGVANSIASGGSASVTVVHRGTGSEGSTASFTSVNSEQSAWVAYRITGVTWRANEPASGQSSFGTSGAEAYWPTADSTHYAWVIGDGEDYLGIVFHGSDDDDTQTGWGPTGWTEENQVISTTGSGTTMLQAASKSATGNSSKTLYIPGGATNGFKLAASEESVGHLIVFSGGTVGNALTAHGMLREGAYSNEYFGRTTTYQKRAIPFHL